MMDSELLFATKRKNKRKGVCVCAGGGEGGREGGLSLVCALLTLNLLYLHNILCTDHF